MKIAIEFDSNERLDRFVGLLGEIELWRSQWRPHAIITNCDYREALAIVHASYDTGGVLSFYMTQDDDRPTTTEYMELVDKVPEKRRRDFPKLDEGADPWKGEEWPHDYEIKLYPLRGSAHEDLIADQERLLNYKRLMTNVS